MLHCLAILLISFVQLLTSNNEVELLFAGDAMQHGPQINNAKRGNGTYDYSNCFSQIKNEISAADYAVVNLECPLGGKPYSGYPCFSAPDEYAKALKDAGFDLFLTANNHTLDRGDKGVLRTISKLDELGIPHVGIYKNIASRDSLAPFITEVKGIKIGFVGYTYGMNGNQVRGNIIVNTIDRDKISNDIRMARNKGAEIVCVLLHWGIEYNLLPSQSQRDLADFLVSQGADLIIGGHPHVIQPYELIDNPTTGKKTLIVYSMGNFISNQTTTDSRGGSMVKVYLEKGPNGAQISEARYNLIFVQKPSSQNNYYQLIPASKPDLIKQSSKAQFTDFVKNARAIFNKHNINVSEQ